MTVLNVTEDAIKELHKSKKENFSVNMNLEDVVVRVGVEGGGCSGFNYQLSFDDIKNLDKEKDESFEEGGITFVVDKKSALFIAGTILDWHDELNRRGFSFKNPNATKSCGCGSSFSV